VYLAGIVLGNSKIVFQRGIFLFHDAGAWFAQIVMFVVLGLLSFPSRLLEVAGEGLLIALVLMFVARPLAVVLTLLPFRFNWRELTLLSWVGLKGAVPITLATFPLILGLPGAALLFDVVFFVVLVSALLQGWTLPVLARRLKLELPAEPIAPVTLEITSLHNVDGDIVEYTVEADSRAVGHRVRELALPEGVVIALIARGGEVIPPQGKTQILAGDHVFVVLRSDTRPAVDRIFGRDRQLRAEVLPRLEVPLRGSITAGELNEFYGIRLEVPEDVTLDLLLRERLVEDKVAPGMRLILGDVVLSVREVEEDGRIEQVGIAVLERRMADKGADARA
jgi:cell volume regulation protein A